MKAVIRIPDDQRSLPSQQKLKFANWSFVEHRVLHDTTQQEVLYLEHAIGFILQGRKIIHRQFEDVIINSGHALFVRRGCVASSEVLLHI